MKQHIERILTKEQQKQLITTLKMRVDSDAFQLKKLNWAEVENRLLQQPEKCWSLYQMEATGGEPNVTQIDSKTGEIVFMDCAAESPKGRRSLCYDAQALASRKENKPVNSAVGMAEEMGIQLLSEAQYFQLQQLGNFDTKTSSWLETPSALRKLDGAIFGDRRYGRVFIYHNGAESYYAGRGFRGTISI